MKKVIHAPCRFGFVSILFSVAITVGLMSATDAVSSHSHAAENVNKASTALTFPPQYQIFDIGVVQTGDTASQGFGISPGGTAVGRSVRSGGAQAFTWRGFIAGLPNIAGRPFCVANGANNNGIVAGTCANTLFGTARLPVIWQNGSVSQLTLPAGETLGDANDVNAAGVAVGSAGSGSLQRGVMYSGGNAIVITQTTSNGSFFLTAFGINDSNRIVGQGIDPTNAARNVGIVYDFGSNTAFEVGALPGANGALAFGVSNAGHVVGSSMMNQGSGQPFIWTQSGGMAAIPLPAGTTQGSARAVNFAGWVVGTGSGQFAVPFLYDGMSTYRLADLIPADSGWDLSMNTSSSALGISDSHVIVGTGIYNGQTHAYVMAPVSAAPFTIGGRVLTANGAGISNAVVTVSGGNLPAPVSVRTGSFGYYNFPGLTSGMTYSVTVSAKRYVFAQPAQMITLLYDVNNFDFVAEPQQ
jgi:hypothetical protein